MRRRPRAVNSQLTSTSWESCEWSAHARLAMCFTNYISDGLPTPVTWTKHKIIHFRFRLDKVDKVWCTDIFLSILCFLFTRCVILKFDVTAHSINGCFCGLTFTYMRPDQVVRQRQACQFSTLTIRGPRLVLALTLIKLEWVPQSGHHRYAE